MTVTNEQSQMWVATGVIDFPVQFEFQGTGELNPVSMVLNFAGEDGFFQMRPVDSDAATKSSWWSGAERSGFRFRACTTVPATESPVPKMAVLRCLSFRDFCLDYLTLVSGAPTQILHMESMYNEDQLMNCRNGSTTEYTVLVFGERTFATRPMRNPGVPTTPPVMRAVRWMRKALLTSNIEDQFLCFFVVCEVLSTAIESNDDTKTVTCPNCNEPYEIPSGLNLKGFKRIIEKLVGNDHKRVFRDLMRLRGALTHGNRGPDELQPTLIALRPVIKQCAVESLQTVIGMPVAFIDPYAIDITPFCQAAYDSKNNPWTEWGSTIREAIDGMQQAMRTAAEPSSTPTEV